MSSFQQQVADVLATLTGRSISWISITSESNEQLIQGQFQTEAGEKFTYQLKQVEGGLYEISEDALGEE